MILVALQKIMKKTKTFMLLRLDSYSNIGVRSVAIIPTISDPSLLYCMHVIGLEYEDV